MLANPPPSLLALLAADSVANFYVHYSYLYADGPERWYLYQPIQTWSLWTCLFCIHIWALVILDFLEFLLKLNPDNNPLREPGLLGVLLLWFLKNVGVCITMLILHGVVNNGLVSSMGGNFLHGLYMSRYVIVVALLLCIFYAIVDQTHRTTAAIHTHRQVMSDCSYEIASAVKWHGATVSSALESHGQHIRDASGNVYRGQIRAAELQARAYRQETPQLRLEYPERDRRWEKVQEVGKIVGGLATVVGIVASCNVM